MTERVRLLILVTNIVITLFNIWLVIKIIRNVREIRRLSAEVVMHERETQTLIAEMNEMAERRYRTGM